MTTKAGSDCISCGVDAQLLQCATCKLRLKDKGSSVALCTKCAGDVPILSAFGTAVQSDSGTLFTCRSCVMFKERQQQELLFQKLKGPDPETILRMVAAKFPWSLVIAKAAPDEIMEGLQFLKRRLSGHRTIQALAESMATQNTQAALMLQQMAQSSKPNIDDSSLSNKVLRTFVKNQCPSIKYKSLLLPPHGSIYKAVRHFQDMLKVEDPLVVALAQERLLLCEWMELQFRPVCSDKNKKRLDPPEMPFQALNILRLTFKSLSNKVKTAALRDEDANLMIKFAYAEHFEWANSLAIMSTANLVTSSLPGPSNPFNSKGKGGKEFSKDPSKDYKGGKQLALTYNPEPFRSGDGQGPSKHRRTDSAFTNIQVGSQSISIPSEFKDEFDKIARSSRAPYDVSGPNCVLWQRQLDPLWRVACRNCWAAGQGFKEHTLGQCSQMGNKCFLMCPKCKQGKHWASTCNKSPAVAP